MNCLLRRIARPFALRVISAEIKGSLTRNLVCQHSVNKTVTIPSLLEKNISYCVVRSKSKKAKYDSDDEDEMQNLDDDSSLNRDSKLVKFNTSSLRTDLILKSALGIARNKIEQQFYESKIRVNGKKIMKKSASVKVGDEIDVIKMVSPKNSDHIYISRVEILNVVAKEDAIAVTARRFKNLLIENYEEDSYKGHAESDA